MRKAPAILAVLALLDAWPVLVVPAGAAEDAASRRPPASWPALSGPYFGQKPPGMRAEMFAPGIVSSEHHDDGPPAFSADGRECVWRAMGQRDGADTPGFLFWSREENGRWTEPRLVPASSPHGAGIPSLQPDGRRLYFSSRRPRSGDTLEADWSPWFVDRTPTGWAEPRLLSLPIGNRRLNALSAGADGALHCVLEDPTTAAGGTAVFRIRRAGDRFEAPEPRGVVPTGAGQRVAAPTFSPDGNTFVFTTRAEQRLFLMVSFRGPEGAWTVPQPVGENVNAPPQTKFAGFSPDGRFFFVVSNRPSPRPNPPKIWRTDVFSGPQREPLCDVYWVDVRVLEVLRPTGARPQAR